MADCDHKVQPEATGNGHSMATNRFRIGGARDLDPILGATPPHGCHVNRIFRNSCHDGPVRCRICIAAATMALWGAIAPAQQAATPIGPAQLRELAAGGQILGLGHILAIVARHTPGIAVDVRAFDGQTITYRVLVVRPDGVLRPVLLDARTGAFLDRNGAQARAVARAAYPRTPGSTPW